MQPLLPSCIFDFSLDKAYRSRLDIALETNLPPDTETLKLLIERHLRFIPFENLSFHGCVKHPTESKIPTTLAALAEKILYRRRGGCCFELNGLLAHYLLELGYPVVRLVPCWVYAGPERGHGRGRSAKFRTRQTHNFILVRTAGGDGHTFLADVGLGEPPLHPLYYSLDMLWKEQETPEGMRSRIVKEKHEWRDGNGKLRRCVRLEWWRPCECRRVQHKCKPVATATKILSDKGSSVSEFEKLRALADKARRRANGKPRSAFKVFMSDPRVRDDAEWGLRQQGKQDSDNTKPLDPSGVRREICTMWSNLSVDDRDLYVNEAKKEFRILKEEADKAEKKVIEAKAEADRRPVLSCDDTCNGGGGYWEPRLQWDIADAPFDCKKREDSFVIDRPLQSFAEACNVVTGVGSTFSQKIVACILTRAAKLTLAGNNLRITCPRFPTSQHGDDSDVRWPSKYTEKVNSTEEARSILENKFGIPLLETRSLKIEECDSRIWEHL